MSTTKIRLAAAGTEAVVALRGSEPLSWKVGGTELLWHGDPEHWNRSAPLLFPVVGASRNGQVRVDGKTYPMPQHGFARDASFKVSELAGNRVVMRLEDNEATRQHFPFSFMLDVTISLTMDALSWQCSVTNSGPDVMPYALGFHPAFPWPFHGGGKSSYHLEFDSDQKTDVPALTKDGLLAHSTREIPFTGKTLALKPELFEEGAIVLLDADSRRIGFVSDEAEIIEIEAHGCPHLALWTKPAAPFLSLEAWSGHADWEDFSGELRDRAAMTKLAPGQKGQHALIMRRIRPHGKKFRG